MSNSKLLFNAIALSLIIIGIMLPLNLRSKNAKKSQMNSGTTGGNKNSKVHTVKILLDSGTSTSIVRKDVLHERHKIHKDERNIWSNMARTFNTNFVAEIILKLSELNHSTEIYAKCHLTDKS